MMSSGRVLIYGGKGALGSACVGYFKKNNWWVGSIDLHANDVADVNILVKAEDDWSGQNDSVMSAVETALSGNKVDAVLCLAGGWAGGNAKSKDLIKNSDLMWKQSVWSSIIASHVASKYLREGGLVAMCGAQAALKGTPGMIGYGLAKAAVHQLVQSLAAEKSGLPANSAAVAILPVTLDTPMNRKFMPNADHSTWTPLEFVAELFTKWIGGSDRPASGSLVQLFTKDGNTDCVTV